MVPPISTSLSGRTFEPRALQDLGDELRRAFARPNGEHLVAMHQERFLDGARNKGVPGEAARKIFPKINGHYMFPESHPLAFAVTAYQAAWLKRHYPVEFFVSMMNNQPMGLYPVETLKQDARRFGVPFLNPCVNRSGPSPPGGRRPSGAAGGRRRGSSRQGGRGRTARPRRASFHDASVGADAGPPPCTWPSPPRRGPWSP